MGIRARMVGFGAIAAAVSAAAAAGAQQPTTGSVGGVVVSDGGGSAVPGALVLLDNGRRIVADSAGRFLFPDVAEGAYRIAAVAPGCDVAVGELRVRAGGELAVRLHVLPPDVSTDRAGEGWRLAPRSEGAAVRVITAEEIRKQAPPTIQDAIRAVAPEMVAMEPGYATGTRVTGGRGRNTVTGSTVPIVIIDGTRIDQSPADALAMIHPEDVFRIEILRGASGSWVHGFNSANGVIRIYTWKERFGFDRTTPPEACGFSFPERVSVNRSAPPPRRPEKFS